MNTVPIFKYQNECMRRQLIYSDRLYKNRVLRSLFLHKERRIVDRETVRQAKETK